MHSFSGEKERMKKGVVLERKCALRELFPECPQEGGEVKGWSSGISKPVSSDAGMTTQEALRALSRMKSSSPPHSLSRATGLLSASSWLQKLPYLFTASHVSYGEPSHPKNTKVIG